MSRTLWFAFLFNFSFFIIFFVVTQYQNNFLNEAGTHLTWTSWSFYSFTVQNFNYQLGSQATYQTIAPTSDAITYANYPTLVFWIYFFGNIGIRQELRKKESKQTIKKPIVSLN
jgi:hypothetical protein